MPTLEMRKPMPVPVGGEGNGGASLKSIVGELPPGLKKYEPYLEAVLHYRELWSRTGVYPFDEAKHTLTELRGDTQEKVLRNKLNLQLNKICEAFPVHNPTKTDPGSIKRALATNGEVRRGECENIEGGIS